MYEKLEKNRREKGLHLTIHSGRIDVELNVTLNQEKVILFLILVILFILILASTLNTEVSKLLLESLLGVLQVLVSLPDKSR